MLARTTLGALLFCALLGAEEPKKAPAQRTIDLAICLDTSGSMDGLINSARRKIWTIVNDLALARPTPRLRVALLTYGNDGHDRNVGWVRVDTDLTEDLDLVSSKLFALATNGGTELVGRVMQTALDRLSWQADKDALKLIVVSGNESADQDREVSFRGVCKKAIERGIMVNSIYCARPGDGPEVAAGWREVALLADGHYAVIDQHRGTVTIATPVDAKLNELSTALNGTYVAYGRRGKVGKKRQEAEDANARRIEAGAGRAQSKASRLYRNTWCLVDQTRAKRVDLAKVEEKDLPKEMQGMTLEEKKAYLDKKWAARKEIQTKIQKLHADRQKYIAAELAKTRQKDDKSFDSAVRKAIRAQAVKKGYRFQEVK